MGQLDMQAGADVVALDAERQRRAADDALSTAGGMLRAAREAMGWSTQELAERTNIKEQHIVSIEEMRADSLPSQPYTMGFVRAYAREVALPEEALMARFRQQIGYDNAQRRAGMARTAQGKELGDGKEVSAFLLLAIVGFVVFCAWKLLISTAPEPESEASRFQFSIDDRETAIVTPRSDDNPVPEVSEPTVEAFSNTQAPAPQASASADDLAAVPAEVAEGAIGTEGPLGEEASATPDETLATEEVVRLRRLAAVDPVYPPLCEGTAEPVETVTVAFAIDGRGRPISRRITQSSNPCFNGAALAALERWRYDPATVTDATRAQTARFTFDRPY